MWGLTACNEQAFIPYYLYIIITIRLLFIHFIYHRLPLGVAPSFGPS